MPIYEYRCQSCAERFEALLARTDEPAPRCPVCGGAQVEKLLSAFAVHGGKSPGPPACGPGCRCAGD